MNSVIKKGIAVISTALLMTGNVLFPIADAAEIAANDEKGLFSDDFESYDSTEDAADIWDVTNTDAASIGRDVSYTYTSAVTGTNRLLYNEQNLTDAKVSAAFDIKNAESDGEIAVYIRYSATGGYRFSLNPTSGLMKLVKNESAGESVIDEYTLPSVDNKYTMSLSAKGGMIIGEVNGTVWLSVYDLTPVSGGAAAIETQNVQSGLTDIVICGENRIFYNDFSSGRALNNLSFITFTNPDGAESLVDNDGYLKIKGGSAKENVMKINDSSFESSAEWGKIKVDANFRMKNCDQMFLRTGFNRAGNSYVNLIHSHTQYSALKRNDDWNNNLAASQITNRVLDANTDFNIVSIKDTDKANGSTQIKTLLDNSVLYEATDNTALCGGLTITCPKTKELWINSLEITDMSSVITPSDIYLNRDFSKLKEDGDVSGDKETIQSGSAARLGANGSAKILLKDKKYKNIDLSCNMNINEFADADGSAKICFRYTDENNFSFVKFSKDGAELKEVKDGVENSISKSASAIKIGSPINVKISAKEGSYKVIVDNIALLSYTDAAKYNQCLSGTIGFYSENTSVDFDDVVIENNTLDWLVDETEVSDGKTYDYSAPEGASEHTRLNAECLIAGTSTDVQGGYQLSSGLKSGKGYTAHIYPTADTIKVNIISPDWSSTFVSGADIGGLIKVGEYNILSLEKETTADNNIKLTFYANGEKAFEFTDKDVRFMPSDGYRGYQVKTKYGSNPSVPTKRVWLEDMRYNGDFSISLNTDVNSLVTGSKVNIKVKTDNGGYETKEFMVLCAMYSAKGTLMNLNISDFSADSGESFENSFDVTVPQSLKDGRIKIMCIDNTNNLNLLCDSIEIK